MKTIILVLLSFCLFQPSFAGNAPVNGGKWEHAPYMERVCSICHERDDVNSPGKLKLPGNETCFMCHDDFKDALSSSPHVHFAAQSDCTTCHNPHNGNQSKFLQAPMPGLCTQCHGDIAKMVGQSKTKHGAVDTEKSCVNCHNPHASKVEKLLNALPYNLCISCHNRDDLVDYKGKKLVNIKKLIDKNPEKHGPVAAKDCSSCHFSHGGDNFRLLVTPYPATFYSAYDQENYKLCFTCHDPAVVNVAQTTTLTDFRNGSQNLHYFHVNRSWGRTCRACHEVHAAENPHIIRNSVPYGNGGWSLKINYEQLPNGGRCSKTCHSPREYTR